MRFAVHRLDGFRRECGDAGEKTPVLLVVPPFRAHKGHRRPTFSTALQGLISNS
jgi:hypothetical protein